MFFLFGSFISLGERLTFFKMSGRETICFLSQLKLFLRVRIKCQVTNQGQSAMEMNPDGENRQTLCLDIIFLCRGMFI